MGQAGHPRDHVFPAGGVCDNEPERSRAFLHTAINNLKLRLGLYLLHRGRLTDFGERANSRKLELCACQYFGGSRIMRG
jgi:hypothetical protein